MSLTKNQYIGLNIANFISSPLSIIGSSTIINLIIRRQYRRYHNNNNNNNNSNNNNNNIQQGQQQSSLASILCFICSSSSSSSSSSVSLTTYETIVLLLSIGDLLISITTIIQSFVIPEQIIGAYWAVGTITSCSINGFIIFFGSEWVAGWNCFLSIYFLLSIRYHWKDNNNNNNSNSNNSNSTNHFTRKKKIGCILIVTIIPTTLSSIAIYNTSFNFSWNSYICFLGDYPDGCYNDPNVQCQRGQNTSPIAFIHMIIIFLFSLIGFISTFLVYYTVRTIIRSSLIHTNRLSTLIENNNYHNNNNTVGAAAAGADAAAVATANTTTKSHETTTISQQQPTSSSSTGNTITSSSCSDTVKHNNNDHQQQQQQQPQQQQQQQQSSSLSSLSSTTSALISNISASQKERIKQTAWQAIYYSLAYLNVFIWPFISKINHEVHHGQPPGSNDDDEQQQQEIVWYILLLLAWFFYPLQGFFNFFIFIRPNIIQYRKLNPNCTIIWIIQQLVIKGKEPYNNNNISNSNNNNNIIMLRTNNNNNNNQQQYHLEQEQLKDQQQLQLESAVVSDTSNADVTDRTINNNNSNHITDNYSGTFTPTRRQEYSQE